MIQMVTAYKITLTNRCMCLGCYYAEDDWKVFGVGLSIEAAVEDLVKHTYKNDFDKLVRLSVDYVYCEEVEGVTIDGKLYTNRVETDFNVDGNIIRDLFNTNPLLIQAKQEKLDKEAIEKEERLNKEKAKKERDEIATFKRLKKKYGA